MIGIYLIKNKSNDKVYVGQSIDIERRWRQHKNSPSGKLAHDMKGFGANNFEFKILETCDVDKLDEREIYYIEKYDSINKGYNVSAGGTGPRNVGQVLTREDARDIINTIKSNEEIPFEKLADEYGCSSRMIRAINSGESWAMMNEIYPIRETSYNNRAKYYCVDCELEISHDGERCRDCEAFSRRKAARPSKEVLLEEVLNESFIRVGEKYGVSNTTIKKWLKRYQLPFTRKELNEYNR